MCWRCCNTRRSSDASRRCWLRQQALAWLQGAQRQQQLTLVLQVTVRCSPETGGPVAAPPRRPPPPPNPSDHQHAARQRHEAWGQLLACGCGAQHQSQVALEEQKRRQQEYLKYAREYRANKAQRHAERERRDSEDKLAQVMGAPHVSEAGQVWWRQ